MIFLIKQVYLVTMLNKEQMGVVNWGRTKTKAWTVTILALDLVTTLLRTHRELIKEKLLLFVRYLFLYNYHSSDRKKNRFIA